jgi:hypothetical protein
MCDKFSFLWESLHFEPKRVLAHGVLNGPPVEDYLAGVADFTGELMRFCVTSVSKADWQVVTNVTNLLTSLESEMSQLLASVMISNDNYNEGNGTVDSINTKTGTSFPIWNDLNRKMVTLRSSLSKCENALCNVRILQAEYSSELIPAMLENSV